MRRDLATVRAVSARALASKRPAPARAGRRGLVATGVVALCAATSGAAQDGASRPTAEAEVFGEELRIEVDLDPGAASAEILATALREALEIERLVDPDGDAPGGIGDLNRSRGDVQLAPRIASALLRAQAFCIWSRQAHGPVGGGLYAAWGLRRSAGGPPRPDFLRQQVEAARCEHLSLDPETSTASLTSGSRVDLWGFERGLAVDSAVDVLQSQGVTNGFVQLGEITRAFGPGPAAASPGEPSSTNGWVVSVHPGGDERIPEQFVVLRDRSISLASRQVQTLVVDGVAMPPYVDQRTGTLIDGKLAVAAVAEQALDAEALSVSLFVMSPREGEFRIGALDPPPAVRWYLGSGNGFPLITERGWAGLPKWRPSDNPFKHRE